MTTNPTPYQKIKSFELRTDLNTKVVADVSLRINGDRRMYRVGVFREYDAHDGTVRRSPWLGVRELMLKPGLEKQALAFIRDEEARRRLAPVAPLPSAPSATAETPVEERAAAA